MNPIVLFVFNRPDHTAATIEALSRNVSASDHPIYVFADGARGERDVPAVNRVREIAKSISGFKTVEVIEAPRNQGLARSVISGVSQVVAHHGRAIVVEDDLVTSPFFLQFMDQCLSFYESVEEVMSVSAFTPGPPTFALDPGYPHDVFFNPRPCPWGWAIWKDRWQSIDWKMSEYVNFRNDRAARREFDRMGPDLSNMLDDQMHGRINSWAVRWTYAHFRQQKVTVQPRYSYVDNIGCDWTGVHCGDGSAVPTEIEKAISTPRLRPSVELEWPMLERFAKQFDHGFKSRVKRWLIESTLWP